MTAATGPRRRRGWARSKERGGAHRIAHHAVAVARAVRALFGKEWFWRYRVAVAVFWAQLPGSYPVAKWKSATARATGRRRRRGWDHPKERGEAHQIHFQVVAVGGAVRALFGKEWFWRYRVAVANLKFLKTTKYEKNVRIRSWFVWGTHDYFFSPYKIFFRKIRSGPRTRWAGFWTHFGPQGTWGSRKCKQSKQLRRPSLCFSQMFHIWLPSTACSPLWA